MSKMAKRLKVLIAEPEDFSPEAIKILSRIGRVECRRIRQSEMRSALSKYDAVWVRLHLKVGKKDIPDDCRCRYIITATTGTDHVKEAEKAGMRVISLRGETGFLKNIRATSEMTVGLILSLVRSIPWAFESVKKGSWERDPFRGHELNGLTAGIVGYGRLGKQVAAILRAFGMKVLVYDPNVTVHGRGVAQVRNLNRLLREADVVSVHVKLDSSTERMFGRNEFRAMKRGAFFINTSRGDLVDEKALLDVLGQKRLAGAALDVLCGEPGIDRRHPLVSYASRHSNLLITPHIGGAAYEAMLKCEVFIARRFASLVSGSERRADIWEGDRHAGNRA
jgi:D-3-phosphoglycerate dehydrogenase